MLRIDSSPNGLGQVLRLEGKLAGPWVDELRLSFAGAAARGDGNVVVDLADVDFIDREGVALLREMVERGARLVNGSAFVLDQLKD